MARLTIYAGDPRFEGHIEKDDFDGAELDLTKVKMGPLGLGHSWNDRVLWIIVHEGTWRLYKDVDRRGEHWDYGPGQYAVGDKAISGFEPV